MWTSSDSLPSIRSEMKKGSTQCVKQTSLEIIVPSSIVTGVVDPIARAAYSGVQHDGRIVVTSVAGAANIRDIESESRDEDS